MGGAGFRAHRRHAISPITWRILIVNLVALFALVGGLLYLGQYRRTLIDNELSALSKQAEIFAAALGEGAAVANPANASERYQALVPSAARQMIRRMVEPSGTRARLFGADGVLIIDSRMLFGPGGAVQVENLPPPGGNDGFVASLLAIYDKLVQLIPGFGPMPPYEESATQKASDYHEVVQALKGEPAQAVRSSSHGMILSVAAPVQRYKQVLGALMLSTDSRSIDAALYEVRIDILKVFAVALTLTVLMSLYLAGTIARPLRRLAAAAEQVRHSHGRGAVLPTFPGRTDEIGDLANVLSEMTETLRQRMDAIEGFAADVAHEIKNPLTSLHSAVETIARITDPEQQRKLMGIIQEDVHRLDRLISDISDASRLDAELSREEMAPVDLTGLLGVVADIQRTTAKDGSADVRVEFDPVDPMTVSGIEGRLVQVFRNLLSNAVSFSPPGGAVTLRLARVDREVEVAVIDSGPGIPEGKEEAIFDRFYTERPEREAFGTHSGLGLSISRQIVQAHGGSLRAENRRDDEGNVLGARFIVRLPAA